MIFVDKINLSSNKITTKWNVTIACQIYIKPEKAEFKLSNAVNGTKIR